MSVGSDFKALVDNSETGYDDVRGFLERLTPEERREAIEAAGGKRRQARLFELAAEGPPIGLEDLIGKDEKEPMEPVIFYGKNSLPSFSIFQKRFCRLPDEEQRLMGYNHQTFKFVTGPGYFKVREASDDERELGTVAIDYTELPESKPEEWPSIKRNEGGFSSLVYGHMVDYLRPLADDVFIGRAVKKGKVTDNYFLLAREDVSSETSASGGS